MQVLQCVEDVGCVIVDVLCWVEVSFFEMCLEGDFIILCNIIYVNSYVVDLGCIEQGVVCCMVLWGKLDKFICLFELYYYVCGGFSVWSYQEVLQMYYQSNLVVLNCSLVIVFFLIFDFNCFYQDVLLCIINGNGMYIYVECEGLCYNLVGVMDLLFGIDIIECSCDMVLCVQVSVCLYWFVLVQFLSFVVLLVGSFLLGVLVYLMYLCLCCNQGVVEKLCEGIVNDEIVLLYQFIVCVCDLSLKGYEVLVCWCLVDEFEIGFDIFVLLVVQNWFSMVFVKVVLVCVLCEMQDLLQVDLMLVLVVNIEVVDIEDVDFIEFVFEFMVVMFGLCL